MCLVFFLKSLSGYFVAKNTKTRPHADGPFITGLTAEEQVSMEAKLQFSEHGGVNVKLQLLIKTNITAFVHKTAEYCVINYPTG